jgi:hypothetical protein
MIAPPRLLAQYACVASTATRNGFDCPVAIVTTLPPLSGTDDIVPAPVSVQYTRSSSTVRSSGDIPPLTKLRAPGDPHVLAMHTVPLAQTLPQDPQFAESVWRIVQ